jgi:hypothetical protein
MRKLGWFNIVDGDMEETEYRRRTAEDFLFFARNELLIDRKGGGKPIPFTLNREQRFAWELMGKQIADLGMVRYNVLKGRQQGISTLVAGLFFWRCVTTFGVQAMIVSKDAKATRSIFAKIKRFAFERPILKDVEIGVCNLDRITFPKTDSSIVCSTARADNVARGSSFSLLHCSEAPYWENPQEQVAALLDSVARASGTMIIFESTARGKDPLFYENFQLGLSGKSDWRSMFIPWHWNVDYRIPIAPGEGFEIFPNELAYRDAYDLTPEQIKWRRYKIYDYKGHDPVAEFRREYPATPEEAFSTTSRSEFFDLQRVNDALSNAPFACDDDPLILGVDIGGRIDPSVVCFRRGQNIQAFESLDSDSEDEIGDWLLNLIRQNKPRRMCVDMGPISRGILQRLQKNFASVVVGIAFGGSPDDIEVYANKRAEMFDRVRLFFGHNSVHLCACDRLIGEMQAVSALPDRQKVTILDKTAMKGALGRSTDYLDALALTFAEDATLCGTTEADESDSGIFVQEPMNLFGRYLV